MPRRLVALANALLGMINIDLLLPLMVWRGVNLTMFLSLLTCLQRTSQEAHAANFGAEAVVNKKCIYRRMFTAFVKIGLYESKWQTGRSLHHFPVLTAGKLTRWKFQKYPLANIQQFPVPEVAHGQGHDPLS
jgi:hypothetical protein